MKESSRPLYSHQGSASRVILACILCATCLPSLRSEEDSVSLSGAIETSRYAVRPVESRPEERWFLNPRQGLIARLNLKGLAMQVCSSDSGEDEIRRSFRWETVAIGYGENLHSVPVGTVATAAGHDGARVEIRRPGMVEWYVNRSEGLEHGYTLETPPAGREMGGLLRVRMAMVGDLAAEVTADGNTIVLRDRSGSEALRYDKLRVWDAHGRELASRMEAGCERITLAVDDRLAEYPLTIDPVFTQQERVVAFDAEAGDNFGGSVAIHGDTAVVGATFEEGVYVFVRGENGWVHQAVLKPSNPGNDHFGECLAISGDRVVVGAPLESGSSDGVNGADNNDASTAGAAYVFLRVGETWTQEAYLKASNSDSGDQFGENVAIDGDTIVVGAPREDGNGTGINPVSNENADEAGAAYVFFRSGGIWAEQAYLKASNPEATDWFGTSIAVSGDTALVGAWFEDGGSNSINGPDNNDADSAGAAYVFVRDGASWSQQAYLKSSNIGENDWFGYSLSISGDTAVVGAYGEDGSASGIDGPGNELMSKAGAAYVFVRNMGVWGEQAYLKASNPGPDDNFGFSVGISGDLILVGAPREDGSSAGVNGPDNNVVDQAGAAYGFRRVGGAWKPLEILKTPDPGSGEAFGTGVAIDDETALVGAPFANLAAGEACFFLLEPLPPSVVLGDIRRFASTRVGRRSRPQQIEISNRGDLPVTALSVRLGGVAKKDFLVTRPMSSLAAGDSTRVKATFKPRHKGSRRATLTVQSNVAPVSKSLLGRGN